MSSLLNYVANDRFYHNITHIGKMVEALQTYWPEHYMNMELKYAILYHDCIYNVGDAQNEMKSMWAARNELNRLLTSDSMAEVERLILLTKKHETTSEDTIGQIIIDLDLHGLSTGDYKNNSVKIRKEFSEVSQIDWVAGRIAWIKSFLAREKIYLSNHALVPVWEKIARGNMEKELNFLLDEYRDLV